MARATDRAGIQFRVLNSARPAVRYRAQADRVLYKNAIRRMLESQPTCQYSSNRWTIADRARSGGGAVTQMGLTFRAPRVVLTSGTFLGGKIPSALRPPPAGAGDPPSIALAQRLCGSCPSGGAPENRHRRASTPAVWISVGWRQWGDTRSR